MAADLCTQIWYSAHGVVAKHTKEWSKAKRERDKDKDVRAIRGLNQNFFLQPKLPSTRESEKSNSIDLQ